MKSLEEFKKSIYQKEQNYYTRKKQQRSIFLRRWGAVAAAFILLAGVGWLFLNLYSGKKDAFKTETASFALNLIEVTDKETLNKTQEAAKMDQIELDNQAPLAVKETAKNVVAVEEGAGGKPILQNVMKAEQFSLAGTFYFQTSLFDTDLQAPFISRQAQTDYYLNLHSFVFKVEYREIP